MKTKKLSEILSRLIDKTMISTGKINDFTPGSVIRSLYEAIALEIEQFYMLTRQNILWGIQEGVLQAFDFKKRKAKRAYGQVTIEFYNPLKERLTISRGTTFTSSKQEITQQFETLTEYYVEPGTTSTRVEVYCTSIGEVGNVPEESINIINTSSTLISRVYNETSFSTGTDEEPIEDVKRRFNLFVETRGRATNKSIRYGATQVDEVAGVYVYEEVGHVTVFTHDRNGELTPELKSTVTQALEDYRPSGIMLEVKPVIKTTQDINVTVTLSDKNKITNDYKLRIESTIRSYLNNFTVSKDLILSDLTQVIMNIDDYMIYDCSYNNITGNVITNPEEILRPGNINVTLV